ncbi:MAG TPA: ABC transporter permease [Vicinamibacterales bacterium]|nr:ABC transporter permease [Vicinamibacterales bacterium]
MLRGWRSDEDFRDEIESHLALEAERLERDEGLSASAARLAARRRFGSVSRARERFFESTRWLWWEQWRQDVRYGARMLRRAPGFTLVAALTIALGVGATTAIFSVVDAALLHPLPYPDADRLVSVEDDLRSVGASRVGMSQPEWLDLERSGIFDQISPAWYDENNLTGGLEPRRVRLMSVAPNYFAVLGVAPHPGRAFEPTNRAPGFTQEAVISHGLWQREFGGRRDVLDRSIRLDTDLYRIVGVMPADFVPPGRTLEERNVDVWAATSFYGPPMLDHPPRSGRNLPGAIGRVKAGLTLAEAQQRVDALVASLTRAYPGDYPDAAGWAIRLEPLKRTVVGDARQPLILLFAAVALVLLIASVNVANLLLARATTRARELALRQALGGGRLRLVRQLITEGVLLSALGGAVAAAILVASRGPLLHLIPSSVPRLTTVGAGWRVYAFSTVVTLAIGVVFGVVAALHVEPLGLMHVLKQQGRASTASRRQARTRRALVVAQFALSVTLMVAAGLLLRSIADLVRRPLGFAPGGVVTVRTRMPYPNDVSIDLYGTPAQKERFYRELLRRLDGLPGVARAALGDSAAIPLDRPARDLMLRPVVFERQGATTPPTLVERASVTPEYFDVLGMTRLRGRLFTDFDAASAPAVAVVNEAMARKFWPGEDPIGRRVKLTRTATAWTTIVGVVGDARTASIDDPHVPQIFSSLYQLGEKHIAVLVRSDVEAETIGDGVRAQIRAVDPTLPVFGTEPLAAIVTDALGQRRFAAEMLALFAATALLLAGIGIYGVMAYAVTERTPEIGVRLVLGASGASLVDGIVRDGMRLAAAGGAAGIALSLGAGQVLARSIAAVPAHDAATLFAVPVLLFAVALVACLVPARRALRVDLLAVIRHE